MPIYIFKCESCGATDEVVKSVNDRNYQICSCGKMMIRDFSNQNVAMVSDIKPSYNESLGMHISSRQDLREKMAYYNSYSPDIPNGNPSDGVLTKEERLEVESDKEDVFSRREQSGWGNNPIDPDDGITVDGEADYNAVREGIKEQHYAKRTG